MSAIEPPQGQPQNVAALSLNLSLPCDLSKLINLPLICIFWDFFMTVWCTWVSDLHFHGPLISNIWDQNFPLFKFPMEAFWILRQKLASPWMDHF